MIISSNLYFIMIVLFCFLLVLSILFIFMFFLIFDCLKAAKQWATEWNWLGEFFHLYDGVSEGFKKNLKNHCFWSKKLLWDGRLLGMKVCTGYIFFILANLGRFVSAAAQMLSYLNQPWSCIKELVTGVLWLCWQLSI